MRPSVILALLVCGACGRFAKRAPVDGGASVAVTEDAPAASVAAASVDAATPRAGVDSGAVARASGSVDPEMQRALREAEEFGMVDLLSADGGHPDDKGKVLGGNGSTDAGAPGVLREGTVSVNGRLPPELIKRLVRHAFDRIRLCYANGLRSNPKLAGIVEIRFVIDQTGAVSLAQDHGSTMPDSGVTQCVVRILGSLSFPQPEGGGIVTVIYPVTLSPS